MNFHRLIREDYILQILTPTRQISFLQVLFMFFYSSEFFALYCMLQAQSSQILPIFLKIFFRYRCCICHHPVLRFQGSFKCLFIYLFISLWVYHMNELKNFLEGFLDSSCDQGTNPVTTSMESQSSSESTVKIIQFHHPCHGQGPFLLDQVAQSLVQPGHQNVELLPSL